jgi:hypothetical protein
MIRSFFTVALLLTTAAFSQAQTAANSPLKITGIEIEKNAVSPEYTIGVGPQKKAPSQSWLWVETSFVFNPPPRVAQPLPELTLNYYILLADVSPQNPKGTLLTGSVVHTGVLPGTETHHSVMLVSPQTLRQFFGGKPPANVSTCFQAIGVTATVNGQLVGELSIGKGKGRPQWWQAFQQGPSGLVLSKDQTPFAPLFYDYFEAVKPKGGG